MKLNIKSLLVIGTCCLFLAGCSGKKVEASVGDIQDSNSIIITHYYGTTVIGEKPQRVAAIGWGNQDTPLALGIVPVGVSMANWGKITENGLLEWTDKAFAGLGEFYPNTYSDTDGLDFEAIADSNPDVILAAYSGITREDYDLLSQIAPTIAFIDGPWKTTWRDETLINAEAIGMKEQGKELVTKTESLIEEELKKYPEIRGKKGAMFWFNPSDLSTYWTYLPTDPRGSYLLDLGLELPESITNLAESEDTFSLQISAEQSDLLSDVDVIVLYGDDETIKAMQAHPLISKIPAVRNGAIVAIENGSTLSASCTPTALSIQYTVKDYIRLIAQACSKVK